MDVRRFHDLKHAYATMPLKSGADDLIVSKTSGHSTVSFTKDIYGQVDEDQQRNEINKASKYF